ncbi:MAG TPA: FCD domain-containing protein [Bosea sp. (in: a-proteobacteria)]|nr:FCD domain-containing protein [Bosea sp. (in: a-proteobacteria)]
MRYRFAGSSLGPAAPKGGVYVAQPHVATDLKSAGIGPFETIDARLLIEPEVAAIAASKVTDGLLAELAACIAQMRQAHAQGHEADAGDHRFHVAIASATGNGMLVAVCDQLWRAQLNSPIWDDIHRRMRMNRYWKVWLNDHEQIFAAIKLGSSIQARIEMIRHLDNVRQALLANSGSPSPQERRRMTS